MKKIDRFRIQEVIGEGAAPLCRGEELLPGGARRTVALRVFPALPARGDESLTRPFHDEITALSALGDHPRIVQLLGAGVTDSVPWIAMQHLPNLGSLLADEPAEATIVMRLLEHVGEALLELHQLEKPLLHSDLKPASILVDRLGNYRVTDLGVAVLPAEVRTLPAGAVRYAAPEQISREFGAPRPASDLYALGHLAYELALGRRLCRQQFAPVYGDERNPSREAPAARWMAWHCSPGSRSRPISEVRKDFPDGLSQIIAKLMAKPLPDRYATAADVLADLRQLASAAEPAAEPEPQPPPPPAPPAAPTGLLSRFRRDRGPAPANAAPPPPAQRPSGQAVGSGQSAEGSGFRVQGSETSDLNPESRALNPSSPTADSSSDLRYYVKLRGRVTGPFDLPTLQRQIRQGVLSRLHQVSTDQVTWKSAGSAAGLFGNPVST